MPVETDTIKALVVEDSDVDYRLLQEYAKQLSLPVSLDRKTSIKGASEAINKKEYDVILLDLHVEDSEGIDTVKRVMSAVKESRHNNRVNIIVMTGTDDWSLAKESLKLGVKDYMKKEDINSESLCRAINFSTYSRNMPKRGKGFFSF